jgi:N-acyl-L-homoserine lactone synthetase
MLHMLSNQSVGAADFIPFKAQTMTAHNPMHAAADESVYLVYVDRDYGLVGGAKLTPVNAISNSAFYRRSLGVALGDKVWECSHVFFDVEGIDELERHDSKAYALTQRFYHDLFDGIRAFAQQKGIKHIITRHEESVHEELHYVGSWPFVVALMDEGTDLRKTEVFGVLSLSHASYETFSKNAASSHSPSAKSFLI